MYKYINALFTPSYEDTDWEISTSTKSLAIVTENLWLDALAAVGVAVATARAVVGAAVEVVAAEDLLLLPLPLLYLSASFLSTVGDYLSELIYSRTITQVIPLSPTSRLMGDPCFLFGSSVHLTIPALPAQSR